MPLTSSLIAGGLGVFNAVEGLIGGGKAKKEAKALEKQRPVYKPDKIFGENVALAESELATGLSSKAKRAYEYATDKGMSSSLDAILKGGGDVNSVGELYGANTEGKMRLAELQDNLRLKQIQDVIATRDQQAQENQTAFQVNELAPFKDKQQAIGQARQAAQQQFSSGLSTIATAGMQYAQQSHEDNLYDKYFSVPPSNESMPTNSTGYQPSLISADAYRQPSQMRINPIELPVGYDTPQSLLNLAY